MLEKENNKCKEGQHKQEIENDVIDQEFERRMCEALVHGVHKHQTLKVASTPKLKCTLR